MSDSEFPPEGRPVDVYLDLLRVRMDSADYRLLLEVVTPALRALDQQPPDPVGLALDADGTEGLPQEIRDEAALVIATALTGRLDNELVEIHTEGMDPIRVVTDSATAHDPARLAEIAGYVRQRQNDTEELRGIAAASDLPTDF